MICKMCKNLNQYKILVYCDPPPMCNLTNKALARYLLESCLKILENVNVGSYRLTAQFTWHSYKLYSARGIVLQVPS